MGLNFEDHTEVLSLLTKAQDVETDNREKVREAHHFLDKRDGQWEPSIISTMTNRPRYTFDKCNPIVDQISGEMEQADFDIRVRPAGGEATKDLAKTYDGLIRNIESMSNAVDVYNSGSREMVAAGLGGWEVVQDWADTDAFEQDLFIRNVPNFEDRVWFDPNAERQDASDSQYAFMLTSMGKQEYDDKFPEGSGSGIGDDRCSNVYTHKKESVSVARFVYKKPVTKTLVLFSDTSVRELDDDLEKVMDELAEQGIKEVRRREKDSFKVFSRLLDGNDWLNNAEETVFDFIPFIPVYGNFKIRESKIIYRGAILHLMDPQRGYNYIRSREIEEIALAPRGKYWGTRKQIEAEDVRRSIQTLNVNNEPFQMYDFDPDNPSPPLFQGGAQVNPGLQVAGQNALQDIQTSSGISGVGQGNAEGPLSGVAIQSLQNKGDNASIKYFKAREIAICHTAKILIHAIPKVYDTQRQVRILAEDDSFEMVKLNERVFDQETEKFVELNNLRQGRYDVTCDVGPAFKNRQQETVKALNELSQAIPGLAEITADIQLKNIASPGIDLAAERVRRKLLEAGSIPETQMTDEEKEEIQQAQAAAAQQQQQPDPIQQALVEQTQAQTADVQSKAQERTDKTQLALMEADRKRDEMTLKTELAADKQDNDDAQTLIKQQELALKQQDQRFNQQQAITQSMIDMLSEQAETLKVIREGMGVDVATGPHTVQAFANQAELITQQQDEISVTPETDEALDRDTT